MANVSVACWTVVLDVRAQIVYTYGKRLGILDCRFWNQANGESACTCGTSQQQILVPFARVPMCHLRSGNHPNPYFLFPIFKEVIMSLRHTTADENLSTDLTDGTD